MFATMQAFISAHPILATSLSSLWGAVLIDVFQFAKSKGPGEFFAQFSWRVAAWRYLQGFVAGFVGNFAVAGARTLIALMIWG